MNKRIELVKKDVKAIISLDGGNIETVIVNDIDFLWQNESGIWPDKIKKPNSQKQIAPILFPIVGPLKKLEQMNYNLELTNQDGIEGYIIDGKFYNKEDTGYFYDNKFYKMSQHGFARDSKFEIVSKDDDKCTIKLVSNSKTKESYPFDFELELSYSLNLNGISVDYKVKNTGIEKMPFNIGDHPGFSINNINDYHLKFDDDENSIGKAKLKDGSVIDYKIENGILNLSKEMLSNKTIVFNNLKSKRCTLYYKDKPVLRYSISADNLLLWSANPDEFICIEPWYGEPRTFNSMQESIEQSKIKLLNPGEEYTFSRKMSFFTPQFIEKWNDFKSSINLKSDEDSIDFLNKCMGKI